MLNFNDFDKSDLPFDTYNQDFKIETYESKDKGDEKNKCTKHAQKRGSTSRKGEANY